MTDSNDVLEARRVLGARLAAVRSAAGYTQHSLAPLTGYVRSTIANVETGRQRVPRTFWMRCDAILDTGGLLTAAFDEIEELVRLRRRQEAGVAGAPPALVHPGGFVPQAPAVASLVAGAGAVTKALPSTAGTLVPLAAPGARFFAGTLVEARVFPAVDDGRILTAVPPCQDEDSFLRRPRRGLVLGAVEGRDGPRLFGLDSRRARQRLAKGAPDGRLLIPRAYALDDLTSGVLWALSNLDDYLLDDDSMLSEGRQVLADYESLPRSAAGRDVASEAATVSRMWLGSQFCALHILRHADALTDVPVFWTREQRGEEASTWLLFAHKYDYLRALADRFGGGRPGATRAFCIPHDAVTDSPAPERVLLLLAVALMESFGIRVDVCAEPEYANVEGFVLDRHRAIVANWVGADGIWQVDVTARRPAVTEYAEASGHAHARSVVAAPTPVRRIRALADYLGLDWSWLTRRCAELGEYGFAGLAAPRSRLLSVDALDRACRYLGCLPRVAQ